MLVKEANVWKQIQDSLEDSIRTLLSMCERRDSTIFHWKLLSSIVALTIAHSRDYVTLSESEEIDGGILNTVWIPSKIPSESVVIDMFFNYGFVRRWWTNTFGSECPKYKTSDMMYRPIATREKKVDLYREFVKYISRLNKKSWACSILYLYIRSDSYRIKLFSIDPYQPCYRVNDMLHDMAECIGEMHDMIAMVSKDQAGFVRDCHMYFMDKLISCDENFLILGKDVETMDEINKLNNSKPNVNNMLEALRMQAVSKGDMNKMTNEEASYYTRATNYLKNVDYVSEDEIEGIIESAFITHGARKGLEIIKQLY